MIKVGEAQELAAEAQGETARTLDEVSACITKAARAGHYNVTLNAHPRFTEILEEAGFEVWHTEHGITVFWA